MKKVKVLYLVLFGFSGLICVHSGFIICAYAFISIQIYQIGGGDFFVFVHRVFVFVQKPPNTLLFEHIRQKSPLKIRGGYGGVMRGLLSLFAFQPMVGEPLTYGQVVEF